MLKRNSQHDKATFTGERKHLCDAWPESMRCFIAILFQFRLEYATGKIQENQMKMELNGTRQLLLSYAGGVSVLDVFIQYNIFLINTT